MKWITFQWVSLTRLCCRASSPTSLRSQSLLTGVTSTFALSSLNIAETLPKCNVCTVSFTCSRYVGANCYLLVPGEFCDRWKTSASPDPRFQHLPSDLGLSHFAGENIESTRGTIQIPNKRSIGLDRAR
jgi:hypothetical protein